VRGVLKPVIHRPVRSFRDGMSIGDHLVTPPQTLDGAMISVKVAAGCVISSQQASPRLDGWTAFADWSLAIIRPTVMHKADQDRFWPEDVRPAHVAVERAPIGGILMRGLSTA